MQGSLHQEHASTYCFGTRFFILLFRLTSFSQECPNEEKLARENGYTFIQMFDSWGKFCFHDDARRNILALTLTVFLSFAGGDIRREQKHAGNIAHLALLCNKDMNCEGFNFDGWLKKTVKDELDPGVDYWGVSCKGLYLKDQPVSMRASHTILVLHIISHASFSELPTRGEDSSHVRIHIHPVLRFLG